MKLVMLESPYRGDVLRNRAYVVAAMQDSLSRGEAPLASHILYPGSLDDDVPAEREHGIAAGHEWLKTAELMVVYKDLGISEGMQEGIAAAKAAGLPVEYRILKGWGLATNPD